MLGLCPRELVFLHDVGQLRLVGEEEGEVGGEDAVLHVAQHLLVLLGAQLGEDVVVLLNKWQPFNLSYARENMEELESRYLGHCVISSGVEPFHFTAASM